MSLFGYFSLGLQSLNAAQLGLQVAGDNISNAFTPGYARRRADLARPILRSALATSARRSISTPRVKVLMRTNSRCWERCQSSAMRRAKREGQATSTSAVAT